MFYVYNLKTSQVMQTRKGKSTWKSLGAAKAFRTRMARMGYNTDEYGIGEFVEQTNTVLLMSTCIASLSSRLKRPT